MNAQNVQIYNVKYYKYFTKQYYKSSLHTKFHLQSKSSVHMVFFLAVLNFAHHSSGLLHSVLKLLKSLMPTWRVHFGKQDRLTFGLR